MGIVVSRLHGGAGLDDMQRHTILWPALLTIAAPAVTTYGGLDAAFRPATILANAVLHPAIKLQLE